MTAVETRPRGVAVLLASPPWAVGFTVLAGAAISLQSYLNGRLGSDVGSPVIAGAINNLVALVAVMAIVLATGALPRARDRLRALGRPSVWHFLGGLAGAGLVLVSAAAAPEVGVALLTVALVSSSAGAASAMRPPVTLDRTMPSARAQRQPWPVAQEFLGGLSRLAESLLTPRGGADELDEARELLAYWEQRARGLPRWAVMRRREARTMAWRWRERVRAAEQARYGAGLLGAASQLAVERRMPTKLAHRSRQAVRVIGYAAVTAAITLALVAAAAVAALLSAL